MSSEVPPRQALLVSPPMPCGLDYVGGVLRRLGIELVSGQRMDLINQAHDAVILVVREPLDAAQAQYRRLGHASRLEFPSYLKQPIRFPNHLPHRGLIAGPLEHYALFCLFWLFSGVPVHVLRFEDACGGPAAFADLVRFVGLTRTPEAIRRATAELPAPETSDQPAVPERPVVVPVEPLAGVQRLVGYGAEMAREEWLMPYPLFRAMAERLRGASGTGPVAPHDFMDWAAAQRVELVGRKRRPGGLKELAWPAEPLTQLVALDAALRLVGDVLAPDRSAPLSVFGARWLGIAAGLARGIDNPCLRWMLPDTLGGAV